MSPTPPVNSSAPSISTLPSPVAFAKPASGPTYVCPSLSPSLSPSHSQANPHRPRHQYQLRLPPTHKNKPRQPAPRSYFLPRRRRNLVKPHNAALRLHPPVRIRCTIVTISSISSVDPALKRRGNMEQISPTWLRTYLPLPARPREGEVFPGN